jgi:hypothetical protein
MGLQKLWSPIESDSINGQNEIFILPSVWISSDPKVDQVPNLFGIQFSVMSRVIF